MTDDALESEVPSGGDAGTPEVADRHLRILEALLFASTEPLSAKELGSHLGEGADVDGLLSLLAGRYEGRGVNLVRRADKWAFRTAEDLAFLLRRDETESRNLSRAALETLAIIAYHQPCTRAEVEEVRGVATGKGTLDLLMEAGWVRMRGRRRTPGRPVTYGIKGAGLLSNRLPPTMQVPLPFDGPLREDEDPLDPEDLAHPENVADSELEQAESEP